MSAASYQFSSCQLKLRQRRGPWGRKGLHIGEQQQDPKADSLGDDKQEKQRQQQQPMQGQGCGMESKGECD
jgi:hypothetical protein